MSEEKSVFSPRNVNIMKKIFCALKRRCRNQIFLGNSWGKLLLKDPNIIFRLSACRDWKMLLKKWCSVLFCLHYFVFNGCSLEARYLIRHLPSNWLTYFTASLSVSCLSFCFYCLFVCIPWCLRSCSFLRLQYANDFFLPVGWHWNRHLLIGTEIVICLSSVSCNCILADLCVETSDWSWNGPLIIHYVYKRGFFYLTGAETSYFKMYPFCVILTDIVSIFFSSFNVLLSQDHNYPKINFLP